MVVVVIAAAAVAVVAAAVVVVIYGGRGYYNNSFDPVTMASVLAGNFLAQLSSLTISMPMVTSSALASASVFLAT